MKAALWLFALCMLLQAEKDPAFEAYKAWDAEHRETDFKARAQSLFEVSAEWVAKWPDSRLAWEQRREALLYTQSHSAELWKQVDENLIRLNPPHTQASSAAYDWVAANVNLNDAEALVSSEMEWHDAQSPPVRPQNPTLADLIDEAHFTASVYPPLCTLADAQIKLREFDRAHATIARVRRWLDGDFKRYYDRDPFGAFPDYESHYFTLSAELARAEGKRMDALAFYQKVITNPYYRREYGGHVKETRTLWNELGGTEEGWAVFSEVPALQAGVPTGYSGMPFLPWLALDYKLPEMNLPGLDSRTWTNKDFEGKATMVYLWAAWCGPCRPHLPEIQALYDQLKDRRDVQIVTLSVDEDREELSAFMREKGYTFPVMVSKPYVEKVLPHFILGQHWIVDGSGSIRLQRTSSWFGGRRQAFIDEALYKLAQVSQMSRAGK
jgi:peroxiredoxin